MPLFSYLRCKKPPLKWLKENHDIKHSVKKGGVYFHVLTCYGLYVQKEEASHCAKEHSFTNSYDCHY